MVRGWLNTSMERYVPDFVVSKHIVTITLALFLIVPYVNIIRVCVMSKYNNVHLMSALAGK